MRYLVVKIRCDKCTRVFEEEQQMTTTMAFPNPITGQPAEIDLCTGCLTEFVGGDFLEQLGPAEKLSAGAGKKSKDFECRYLGCEKAFMTERGRNKHERIHDEENR